MPKTTTGYKKHVYFIRGGDLMKVGFSKDVERRFKGLCDANYGTDMELVAVVPGARELERAIHEELAPQRRHGEWFDVDMTRRRCELLADECRNKSGATSKTAREVLKSKVWAEGELVADPKVGDDEARAAWGRAKLLIREWAAQSTTPAHERLARQLKAALEIEAKKRQEMIAARNRPGGIEPPPPPAAG